VHDLLDGITVDWKTTSDFPVYCCDGIAWSNRVIIGEILVFESVRPFPINNLTLTLSHATI
jgi:hypothetical protein